MTQKTIEAKRVYDILIERYKPVAELQGAQLVGTVDDLQRLVNALCNLASDTIATITGLNQTIAQELLNLNIKKVVDAAMTEAAKKGES